jgi:ABC-type oligopeptide transport system ATPase subunit
MAAPLLHVDAIEKRYTRGIFARNATFSLEADFVVEAPTVVGVMGPNGSGKTTLFELITGSNLPSAGHVRVAGQDIHRVRYRERDRLAIHYHQSYQVRAFKRTRPSFMLEAARSSAPLVHLFDEPQFNTQDGYIGFMVDFFRRLPPTGKARVPLPASPNEPWHLGNSADTCERFLFVDRGTLTDA